MKNTFGLDKNYEQFNFEEVSVEELQVISGGSGGGGWETGLAMAGGIVAISAGVASIVVTGGLAGIIYGAVGIAGGTAGLVGGFSSFHDAMYG